MEKKSEVQQQGLPGWLWTLLIVVPALILIRIIYWWMLLPSYKRMSCLEIETPRKRKQTTPHETDDLTKIKGIGPKISQALQNAGVYNFTQLALLDGERLERILDEANARMSDIEAIQTQARFSANKEWDELTAFQETI